MSSANRYNTPHRGLKREKSTMSSDSETEEAKDPVQVYCRLRPPKQGAASAADIKLLSTELLSLTTPPCKGIKKEVQYKFHHIFTGYSTQSEIFGHVAVPLLEDLLSGKNGLLFTYGVTGSGKTHTLTGDQQDPGIMPRCIDTIFNSIGEFQAPKYIIKSDKMNGFEIQSEDDALHDRLQTVRSTSKRLRVLNRKPSGEKIISYANDGTTVENVNPNNLYSVFVSYIEIYNNSVFDLLDESSGKTLQNKILREDVQKNMYVNGVVEIEVKSPEEAFEVFHIGQQRKKMAATNLNADSSRSHSIFNIRLVQVEQIAMNENGEPTIPNDNVMKIGQLSLVDLAGSERTNRTNNTGVRLKEASSINNSLMSLRSCLEILRENQKCKANRLVPYRDSRLTFLFKRYFEGDGNVRMIVCVNPSVEDVEENLQVLKFAEMIQDIKISKAEVKATPLKKTMKANKENATPASVKKTSSFTLLPPIDIVKFDLENMQDFNEKIDRVISTLKLRAKRYAPLKKETDELQAKLRKRLEKINSENVLTRNEIKCLKAAMQKEKKRNCNIQIKMTDAETANENLKAKNAQLEDVVKSLHNAINEKDRVINQKILEKEKHKQKLTLESEKMNQELDAKLRRQREHLNAVMKAKDDKLRIVKEIIDSEMPPVHMNLVETESECPPKFQSTQTHVSVSSSGNRRNLTGNTNTPRHRRSRSAGPEVWLEHNSVKPVPLGTVFQPSMKKRKSVSKLDKASDVIHPKQSKYCLITQEPDTDGETETKMYKADIVPTCGGGAQVIFNDVERLRQESPTKSPK